MTISAMLMANTLMALSIEHNVVRDRSFAITFDGMPTGYALS